MKVPAVPRPRSEAMHSAYWVTLISWLCAIVLSAYPALPAHASGGRQEIFNVRDFGAHGDGTLLDTPAVQAAIDSCYRSGGGTVYFPSGRYLVGSILLKSNVFLMIGNGATILGSTRISDYTYGSLIYAEDSRNIGIVGHGLIDGHGESFWMGKKRPYARPRSVIRFVSCENVTIKGINIRNAPRFSIYLRRCELVMVTGISIKNEKQAPNTDGVDPSGSSNVFLSNCYISTGDDAICLKSDSADAVTSNVVVSDCVLESDDSAIKCGTDSWGTIRNCTFDNIDIRNSRYGIALFMKDGGVYEDLEFSNIVLQTETSRYAIPGRYSFPICIDIEKRTESSPLGTIRNITFNDIDIETYNGGCLFLGQPSDRIEGVTMNDVSMSVLKRADFSKRHKPRGTRTLTNVASNDYAYISSHLTFAYVGDLSLHDVTVKDDDPNRDFERYTFWAKGIRDVLIDGLRTEQIVKNRKFPTIALDNAKNVTIRDCDPDSNGSAFVRVVGKTSTGIRLIDNFTSRTAHDTVLGPEVSKNAVQTCDVFGDKP